MVASFISAAPTPGWVSNPSRLKTIRLNSTPIPMMPCHLPSGCIVMKTRVQKSSYGNLHFLPYLNLLRWTSSAFQQASFQRSQSPTFLGGHSSLQLTIYESCRRFAKTKHIEISCLYPTNLHSFFGRISRFPSHSFVSTLSNFSKIKFPIVDENGDNPTCA